MIKDYNQTLPGLEQDIIKKINVLENKRILLKKRVFGFISFSSLVIVSALSYSIVEIISTSGVLEYVSLFFSDIGNMSTYWKEITLSITETLPIMEIGLSLSLVLIFFWSLLNTLSIRTLKINYDTRY